MRAQALSSAAVVTALLAAAIAGPIALAAGPDANVEWNGVSHVWWQDRRPLCPVDGESFQVRFQTYADDITSARVACEDGDTRWVDAFKLGTRGPYDLWAAQVPSTSADVMSYLIELTDGPDTDYVGPNGPSDTMPAEWFELDFASLEHAPLGSTLLPGGGTVFRVWAPGASTAHVRGEFNGWNLSSPMTKTGEHFVARVPAASDRDMYKYYFDGGIWKPDARPRGLNSGENYNTYIEDPFGYDWQDETFTTPRFEEMVIYQLHVGTFSGRNDPYGSAPFPARYVDVAARASHLAELGVNAVMLNPVTEFPWDYSAGYNPITAWSPEWKYGTPDEFKSMVDALHAEGIAVLLDIVWNHFSTSDNFLWEYDGTQIYFDDPVVGTPWGDQADFDRGAVRDYFANSALYWLEEMHLDGFRMDATSYMNIEPQEAAGWSLMQRMNDEMDNRWVDKIAIAEQLPDNSWVTRPTWLGGAGFDAQYHDAFTDRLREEILDAAYGDPEMWKIRDILNGSGEYLSGRYVVNYLELHDEAWPSSGGQRIVKTIDTSAPHDDVWAKGRFKLGHGLCLVAPGIPAFLQGTEWLEDSDFGTDSENRIDWSKKTTYAPIFEYFKDLVALRTSHAALEADAGCQVFHVNDGANVLAFQRYDLSGNVLVIVVNFGNSDYGDYRIGLPAAGDWVELVNSQDPQYAGDGPTNGGPLSSEAVPRDGFDQSVSIAVPKMALIVLEREPETSVEYPPTDAQPALSTPHLKGGFPNPFRGTTTVAFELPRPAPVRLSVYDVAGRLVRRLADAPYEAGAHRIPWDGKTRTGSEAASGIYIVRLEAERTVRLWKAVLLR